jgi:glycosyltransferase involved in cell wall biosynthesis
VTISCSGKFHAFALAEQMERLGKLDQLYTTYAFQKNKVLAKLVKRIDKEKIPASKIRTNSFLAFPLKFQPGSVYLWNDYFDRWVASNLVKNSSKVFIGWSGMSLHSIKAAQELKKITILERGSSHIVYQNELLKEEYKKYGKDFSIDHRVINKELEEYAMADYISVPSNFVRDSFIEKGISPSKLIMNPYGAGNSFYTEEGANNEKNKKFTIVYLGSLTIRKGLLYLFQALAELKMDIEFYDVWFIGKVDDELEPYIAKYKKSNWTFFGQINHYQLKDYLVKCHVGVQPSVEEGLSMVIPQMMACGVAMIVTPNTGGGNIIQDGFNGFIVPIRTPSAISERISYLFEDQSILDNINRKAAEAIKMGFTWNDYGDRYNKFLKSVV